MPKIGRARLFHTLNRFGRIMDLPGLERFDRSTSCFSTLAPLFYSTVFLADTASPKRGIDSLRRCLEQRKLSTPFSPSNKV